MRKNRKKNVHAKGQEYTQFNFSPWLASSVLACSSSMYLTRATPRAPMVHKSMARVGDAEPIFRGCASWLL